MPSQSTPIQTAADPETGSPGEPDFDLGLGISDKPGSEFASFHSGIIGVQIITTQGFAAMFLAPPVFFFTIRRLGGAALLPAVIMTILIALVLFFGGLRLLMSVRPTRTIKSPVAGGTDTRYRVRAVIPPTRRNYATLRRTRAFLAGHRAYDAALAPGDFAYTPGGFEPIITRPWFGIKRDRAYMRTGVVCGIAGMISAAYLLQLLMGGWGALFDKMALFGYAVSGLAIICGLTGAELCWPVYLRLAPGRLDIFRYKLLGHGTPDVTTYDLRKHGLSVDFATYAAALETPRPPGEPAPEPKAGKKWPHANAHAPEDRPDYFSIILSPDRKRFCQRLIQAARTTEPTPELPEKRLVG